MLIAAAVILAFLIDSILGDPPWLWHPVIGIGKLITLFESLIRKILPRTPKGELVGGLLLFLLVSAISAVLPFTLLLVAKAVNFWLYFALCVILFYTLFAARSLRVESMYVYTALAHDGLPAARKMLSRIVGRDTTKLSEPEVIKAAVETVAENTTDGVIAPMFYMLIGGVPLAFLYKAVNTLDSMVGYKNDKYLFFGRVSARADDLLNFIPARLAGIIMVGAAFFARLSVGGAARTFLRDRNKHASPNSAQTESACAGALGIALGGDALYFGKLLHKPAIGDKLREPERRDIKLANRLMYVTSGIGLAIFALIRVLVCILLVP